MISEQIVYLTLCQRSYPKRLSFLYLAEICDGFLTELTNDYGSSHWRNKIGMAARPYQFIKFDKYIQKKCKEYVDPSSRVNTSKVNSDLTEIQTIMKKNIEEVLNRGEKLDRVQDMSNGLVDSSKKFKWGAKKLSFQALVNMYAPVVAMGLFVLFVVWWKLF